MYTTDREEIMLEVGITKNVHFNVRDEDNHEYYGWNSSYNFVGLKANLTLEGRYQKTCSNNLTGNPHAVGSLFLCTNSKPLIFLTV